MSTTRQAEKRLTFGLAGIADFRSILGQETIRGIVKGTIDNDVNLINYCGAIKYSLTDDIEFFEHYRKKYRYMNAQNIDGLITWASSLREFVSDKEIIDLHYQLGRLPLVSIGVPVLPNVPEVITKSTDGIRVVMEHLVDKHGYRRIGFFSCEGRRQYQERLDSYRAFLEERGIPYYEKLVWTSETLEPKDVRKIAEKIALEAIQPNRAGVEAIVTVSDMITVEILHEFEQRGIRVPEDVALTGFNNQLQSIRASTPITSVDLGFFEKGYRSVGLLVETIRRRQSGQEPPAPIVLPSVLVVRQSCGCFEEPVERVHRDLAGNVLLAKHASLVNSGDHFDFSFELAQEMELLFPLLNRNQSVLLATALMEDLDNDNGSAFLRAIRTVHAGLKTRPFDYDLSWQALLSGVRHAVLPIIGMNRVMVERFENRIHQARILIAVFINYANTYNRPDNYQFTALAKIAIDFASATEGAKIIEHLTTHLVEIPNSWIVLQDRLQADLGDGHLVVGATKSYEETEIRVPAGALVPQSLLPQGRRWSIVMEILYQHGKYMGYVLLEMGPENISLYDTMRTLLSYSLFGAYVREGRSENDRDKQALLRSDTVRNILSQEAEKPLNTEGLKASSIIEYLIVHIQDMTNLDLFSADLNISKSHLIKKTKQLTGYTVQALHELLKMERAKLLLDLRSMKIAEVAARLGYQNQFYFSKVFRKSTGMSPREWVNRKA